MANGRLLGSGEGSYVQLAVQTRVFGILRCHTGSVRAPEASFVYLSVGFGCSFHFHRYGLMAFNIAFNVAFNVAFNMAFNMAK
jgi:hypothetical protein